jgi:hypothetical protein
MKKKNLLTALAVSATLNFGEKRKSDMATVTGFDSSQQQSFKMQRK